MDLLIKRQLYVAAKTGDLEGLKALIEQDPSRVDTITPFGTLLHCAAEYGHLLVVKYLVASGADVNIIAGILGGNVLNSACSNGHLEITRYLYERGSRIDVSEPTRNPLFGAILGGYKEIVEYLIDLGIDTKIAYSGCSMKNMDALAFARERGQREIAKLLETLS